MYQDGSFKSINEKVYKILVKQNDDNRELAETTDISDEVDKIQGAIQTIEGFCIDFVNKLTASIIRYDPRNIEYLQVGKFITSINSGINLIEKLDINSASKPTIEGFQTMLDTIEEYVSQINFLQPQLLTAYNDWAMENRVPREPDDDDTLSDITADTQGGMVFNVEVVEKSMEQLLGALAKLTSLLSIKLLNYKQNQQNISREQGVPVDEGVVLGAGSSYKFSLFNTAPYQPVQKLKV